MKAYSKQTLIEYYVDYDTPNISFIKMWAILNEMGIKNNTFFLRIDNKSLIGVNPYSSKLTEQQKYAIFQECANNRWYFYREVFRVAEAGAATGVGGGSEFKLNRGNLAYLWAMELNISTYMILPRQTGKTVAAVADCTWTHQFARGSSILHFNKNQTDANDNLRRISQAIQMLPMYMQHSNVDLLDPSDKRNVKNSVKTIRNTINASIEAMASAGNEAKADAIARGRTASKIWYDEMAFIFFNSTIYTAATPAYEKAREIAEKNGNPYAISITTTPGDLCTPHGAWSYKMMNDAYLFTEDMYDWKRKKLYDRIYNTPGKTGFIFIQFSYLQLGETEEWYLERAQKMNDPLRARREYLLEWINSNGNSPFDPDDIELIGEIARQKVATQYTINKYFQLNVYDEYHGRKPVIIGVDVAAARGRDCTAAVVVNPDTLQPIAIFKSNMIPSDVLRKLLITLVTKRYPNCILTVENNSIGGPLLDELRDSVIGRVLYKERKKRQVDQGVQSFTKKRKLETIEYGHNTNTTSRAQMMEMLEHMVAHSHSHLALPELYEEISHLELRNGRIDHNSATHDDVVMAYMGALWIVRYGTGLKGKGIYWTINDDQGGEEIRYDTTESRRIADLAVYRKGELTPEDKFIEYMSKDYPVEDSITLASQEAQSMFKAMDVVDGIEDEDEYGKALDNIPDSTQRLLMKNYYAMLGMDDSPEDHILDLLAPMRQVERGIDEYDRSREDWSTLYKY